MQVVQRLLASFTCVKRVCVGGGERVSTCVCTSIHTCVHPPFLETHTHTHTHSLTHSLTLRMSISSSRWRASSGLSRVVSTILTAHFSRVLRCTHRYTCPKAPSPSYIVVVVVVVVVVVGCVWVGVSVCVFVCV